MQNACRREKDIPIPSSNIPSVRIFLYPLTQSLPISLCPLFSFIHSTQSIYSSRINQQLLFSSFVREIEEETFVAIMKFWKILKSQIEQTLPEWRDQFLSYKNLKKQLKIMCPKDALTPPRLNAHELNRFLRPLEDEIDKFNAFFVDKEEEYIIKWKELQDRVARATGSYIELISLGREIVDFHGEMILLQNYSQLNYIGLVKIIKKYDKRTGELQRLPFIQEVMNQPFFETDVINKLVNECEIILGVVNDWSSASSSSTGEDFEENGYGPFPGNENREGLADIENMENLYTRLTLSALRTLEEIRGRSSTVSIYSLPPLHD